MIEARLARKIDELGQVPVLLVASDYDGVLSPIVDDPAAAHPDQAALDGLVQLGQLPNTHAVAISGRSRAALQELTRAPSGVVLIGTHGAEWLDHEVEADLAQSAAGLQVDLQALSLQFPGSVVELKPIGAAFHYRNAANGDRAFTIAHQLAASAGARTIAGKKVVECIFGDSNKGSALRAVRETVRASAVVFIGDDTTDKDAFAELGDRDAGIKVGPGVTAAKYRVAAQYDVAAVVDMLVIARRKATE